VVDWTTIVEQYGPTVWRTVNRLVPSIADSEDCFQKAFISAWKFSQTQRIRNWQALLRRMATARALERCRELIRHRGRLTALPDAGLIDKRLRDPADNILAMELEERLRFALAEIDHREAEVFCLTCLEGFTYREVGAQLGLSVNHVGVLLNRARSTLQEKLGHPLSPVLERSK